MTTTTLDDRDRELLRRWNQTAAPFPRDVTAHQLFEAHAARAPEAIAVVWGDEEITYRELNARSNRLAHHLLALGLRPDTPVAICLERSAQMVVAWMAALKAGGAYVHLDPDYPPERKALMLEDSGAPFVITEERLARALPASQARPVRLDTDAAAIAARDASNPRSGATPETLAYVVYTSGSTGRPKGIGTSHSALVRLVVNCDYLQFGPEDRVAQCANPSFDLVKPEMWGPLLNGGRLVGIPKDVLLSPQLLAEEVRRREITVLIVATALFNQIARTVPSAFESVKHVLFGGEAAAPQCVAAVLRSRPPKRLVHVYGPAENSCFTTWHLVTGVPEGAATVPIGKPMSNSQVYVLGERRELLPVGAVGELYIGGPGLARGYLGKPELTAERFVPDPFAGEPGARMYRTGDQVRWSEDGALDFIGRVDFQVKLHGYRIEMGEVESVLAQHPDVAHVQAIIREDQPGDRRLVAYAVLQGGAKADPEGLRRFLRNKLPAYMVPSAVVVLDEFPLNPNGKIDRSKFPPPALQRREPAAPPRTPQEQALAKVWAEVLAVDEVGIHDSFFDLGGHSLLAIRLCARMADTLGEAPPLSLLLQAPTIAALVEAAKRRDRASAVPPTVVTLQAGGSKRPLFCIPGVTGMGVAFADLVRHLGGERPVYALQSRGFGGEPALTSIDVVAADSVKSIRAVQPAGPYLLLGYSMGGTVAYEMARQLREQGQQVGFLGLIDSDCLGALPVDHAIGAADWAGTAAGMGLKLDGPTLERLVRLGPDELSPAQLAQVLASGLGPPGTTLEELRPLIPVLRSNFFAFYGYRPKRREASDGKLTLFRAGPAADLGWAALAPTEVLTVPGQHHSVIQEPHVAGLARRVLEALAAASA